VLTTGRRVNPISFEVIKNALDSIADQAAIALMRTAYSTLAQGLTTPFHLGSFPDAMSHLLDVHGETMLPGDVFILNDPYGSCGMHLLTSTS